MLRLLPHPDGGTGKVENIHIGLSVDHKGMLWVRFHVDCGLSLIETGDYRERTERVDELWRSTCFEAFVRRAGEGGYCEFNFALDNRWAAYRFDGYRDGMQPLSLDAPELGLDLSDSHIALEASLTLPVHLVGAPLDIGMSAIVEQTDGIKSYWALAHPNGKPDFHHDSCFALKLAPPIVS